MMLNSGRFPDGIRAAVTAETVLVLEEGLPGSVTYRHFRGPGERARYRKDAVSGAIAVTSRRFVVWAGRFKHIDVPHTHPMRAVIEVTEDRPGRVCFRYDAGAGNTALSGQVEVRLRTPQATQIVTLLNQPWD
jgi:hypothetical protein